jgi:hypothetical protein
MPRWRNHKITIVFPFVTDLLEIFAGHARDLVKKSALKSEVELPMRLKFVQALWTAALVLSFVIEPSFAAKPAAKPVSPSISSFVANPASITAGSTSSLTGVFANGTGVITPGNLAVSSGVPVTVPPSATTTYTLKVTGSNGRSTSKSVTVTVTTPPSISSFTANPTAITAGSTSNLTGVFTGGTGVITPGNLAVTSGKSVSVMPPSTTTYTLTVTASGGASVSKSATVTVTSGAQTSVTVNQSSTGPAVTENILGMNMAVWFDPTNPAIVPAFATAGIKTMRWPGGSDSDVYHWQTNTLCEGGYSDPNATFNNMVNDLAIPAGLDVAITANYGSNAACTGPGDPTEAAAWVTAALNSGARVTHWTVGNEVYGSWETDLHTVKNDPTTYANAVATGYYPQMKAANPNALVGVVVNPGNSPAWDPIVLSKAPYDFVEYHYYAQAPGQESDIYLVQNAAQAFTTALNSVKADLASAGKPNTPIYVGELGSVYSNPGKQTSSITQALFAGQVLGEMMNAGVSRATWWLGFGGCSDASGGNFSSSLYGWQNFGGYMVFSDGTPEYGCTGATPVPVGTLLPTARAFQLFSNVAVNGESVLSASVAGDTTDIRAYAATNNGGTALVLFNLNETTGETVSVSLSSQSSSAGVTVQTYSKAIYDQSQNNVWAAPTTANLGAQNLPLSLTLAPWSMNVVILK